MSFDKYLKAKPIVKTIDPGPGSSPLSTNPTVPLEVTTARDIPNTSLATMVDDLQAHALQVQTFVTSVINDIVTTNSSDPGFTQYVSMVKANYFDPTTLTSGASGSTKVFSDAQVKIAERDVYRRVVDPRAPFVQDLHNMLSEAGLTQLTMKSVFNKIVSANNLYSEFDNDDRLTRYTLFKERQHLDELSAQADRIQKTKSGQIADNLLRAITQRIIDEINVAAPKEIINKVNDVINFFNQIKTLLGIAQILNTENWERFATDIKDVFGEFVNYSSNRIAKAQIYSIVGGLQDKILTFTDDIEKHLPFGLQLSDIPELRELQNQIDSVFLKSLSKVEDNLVQKEGDSAKLEEARRLMVMNTKKNLKTKEFMATLTQVINALQELKRELQAFNTGIQFDTAEFLTTLRTRLANFNQVVAISPYGINPDLYPDGQQQNEEAKKYA